MWETKPSPGGGGGPVSSLLMLSGSPGLSWSLPADERRRRQEKRWISVSRDSFISCQSVNSTSSRKSSRAFSLSSFLSGSKLTQLQTLWASSLSLCWGSWTHHDCRTREAFTARCNDGLNPVLLCSQQTQSDYIQSQRKEGLDEDSSQWGRWQEVNLNISTRVRDPRDAVSLKPISVEILLLHHWRPDVRKKPQLGVHYDASY